MHRRNALRAIFSASTLGPGLLAREPHIQPRAKRVILLYMTGGVSQVDSFDYKPELDKADGKRLSNGALLFKSQWKFKPRGESGLYISELFPHIAECADELCVLNSMRSDHNDHFEATLALHHSLGSAPFVVLAPGLPYGGALNWPGAVPIESVADEGVLNLERESDETLSLYGVERGCSSGFAWQCLMARRLAEREVRFIEVVDSSASQSNWDAHADIGSHAVQAKNVDKPIAALLKDLRLRGLLDDTLVVWTSEFGRTPYRTNSSINGREHQCSVFTSWMAGGGVKRGFCYGNSDEISVKTGAIGVHLSDFKATIVHSLGLHHDSGRVITQILA